MFLEVYPIVLGVSNLKHCRYCNQYLPLDAFSARQASPDGLAYKCRACDAEYHKARYRSEHGKASRERYRAENAEAIAATKREWRAANPEKVKAHKSASQKRNRASANERVRRWNTRNPERRLEYVHRRRARINGAGGSYTPADIEAIRIAQGNRCYICHKKLKRFHIDHFIPLALGGTNDAGNLRLACPKCNMSKHDKHPHELGLLL